MTEKYLEGTRGSWRQLNINNYIRIEEVSNMTSY